LGAAGLGIGLGVFIGFHIPRAPTPTAPPAPSALEAVSYEKVGFSSLPGWNADQVSAALPALRKSCARFADNPPDAAVGTGAIARPASAWQRACGEIAPAVSDDDLRRRLERLFVPYAVAVPQAGAGPNASGKFTGYYEADLKGSLTHHGPYQVPIYSLPRDLVTVDLKQFIADPPPALPQKLVGHVDQGPAGNALVPYFTRRQIDREHVLADRADVLAWSDDPVAVHILHIQGSGRMNLDDGRVLHIGFAGHNGLAFRGIGSILIAEGVLKPGEANMDRVRTWLHDHPTEAAQFMDENARYIFFRINSGDAGGPVGAFGVSLTPGRSLAVDPRFVPLGMFLWLDTTAPSGAPIQRLVAAQDTGAAIMGPVRGDLFWGDGDDAFAQAARMNSPGRYFVLVPNP
jgi:membrane-bound lytic murein transglycosylase A